MSTQIFNVDFTTKKVTDKYIGANKVEYYTCNCCAKRYAKTKADPKFMQYVSWQHEINKRVVQYYMCKNCIENMAELIKE